MKKRTRAETKKRTYRKKGINGDNLSKKGLNGHTGRDPSSSRVSE